jgi:hypothetical protein
MANLRGTFVVNRQASRDIRDGGAIVNLTRSVVGSTWPTHVADAATAPTRSPGVPFCAARSMRHRTTSSYSTACAPMQAANQHRDESEHDQQKRCRSEADETSHPVDASPPIFKHSPAATLQRQPAPSRPRRAATTAGSGTAVTPWC